MELKCNYWRKFVRHNVWSIRRCLSLSISPKQLILWLVSETESFGWWLHFQLEVTLVLGICEEPRFQKWWLMLEFHLENSSWLLKYIHTYNVFCDRVAENDRKVSWDVSDLCPPENQDSALGQMPLERTNNRKGKKGKSQSAPSPAL